MERNAPSTRRRILSVLGAGGIGALAGCTGDDGTADSGDGGATDGFPDEEPPESIPDELALETVVDGLESPVDVAFLPGGERRYVATRPGEILVQEGADRGEPLLDLGDRIVLGGERGLLGIALHPQFPDDRRLFVRYSSPPREGTPDGYSHTFVLSSFQVDEDGRSASPDTERTVLEIPQPMSNHNAGDLAFGPDGYLYVPTGDGGGSNDVGEDRPEDWYEGNAGGHGQDTAEALLGGVLRIDVDDGDPYAIPPDNPLVDAEGHYGEYYAWGLRNPWRLSFDGEDLFVGDVGQNRWEEVDLVERGGNYGWNVREGSRCFDAADATRAPEDCPDETPPDVRSGEPLLDPILEYPNSRNPHVDDPAVEGVAVVGGCVYRGSALPELEGTYLFGDLQPRGRLFVGVPPNGGADWSLAPIDLNADGLDQLLALGRDPDGEVYVLSGGGIHRIGPA